MFLKALLFSLVVFVALGIIAMIVAAIMKIVYIVVNKSGKKPANGNNTPQHTPVNEKAGQA